MNLIAGVVVFCLIPLLGGVLYWGGKLVGGLSGGRAKGLPGGVIVLAALVAVGLLALSGGRTVQGVVAGKSETIELSRYELIPTVIHHLRVTVTPAALSERRAFRYSDVLELDTDPGTFDRLSPGQTVAIARHGLGPLAFGRLRGGPPWAGFPYQEAANLEGILAKLLTLVAVPALAWARWAGPRGRALIVTIVLSAVALDALALRSWWIGRAEHVPAVIVDVQTVREATLRNIFGGNDRGQYATIRLPQAYDEVQLRFSPTPGSQPVLAVDRVDAGSTGKLAVGQTVEAAFSKSAPREARIAGGSRSYAWRAYLVFGLGMLAVTVLFGVGGGWLSKASDGLVAAARRSRERMRPQSAGSGEDPPGPES